MQMHGSKLRGGTKAEKSGKSKKKEKELFFKTKKKQKTKKQKKARRKKKNNKQVGSVVINFPTDPDPYGKTEHGDFCVGFLREFLRVPVVVFAREAPMLFADFFCIL